MNHRLQHFEILSVGDVYVQFEGETPLHFAADAGSLDAMQTLLDAGADPNSCEDDEGQPPLMFAILNGHNDAAALLVCTVCEGR